MAIWWKEGFVKIFWLLFLSIFLTACNDYTEEEREIGYKGKARINPWLAAERFSQSYEGEVKSLGSWEPPEMADSIYFIPASILSNESFTRRVESWVNDGGHLVLLIQYANAESSDWSEAEPEEKIEPVLINMLDRAGITLTTDGISTEAASASQIDFNEESYQVNAKSRASVKTFDSEPGVFASVESGAGRISVLTDARLFRNRWIGDNEHAEFLDALIQASTYVGDISFIRGSGLSLWRLIRKHLWSVLLGLFLLTLLWLWKNFSRFGPMEAATDGSTLRGYDHHLEALGDFQWRLDRAVALLTPLRAQIVERGQRVSLRSGRRDDDFSNF
ncbi:MAG: hypothetical protein HC767_10920 [Akkermansiaceae bacterium]|nr:hypothetical protein [Akkermansiaceae bacterium]